MTGVSIESERQPTQGAAAPETVYESNEGRLESPSIDVANDDDEKTNDSIDPYAVLFEKNDPDNPRNWPLWRKLVSTALVAQISFCLTTSSSISSSGAQSSAEHFGTNEYLGDMATGLYFIGFGVGVTPIGPLSEIYGRNLVYFSTFLVSNLFCLGCALAPNIQTLLVCRFLSGVFGAAPLSNAGGSLADVSDNHLRSWLFPTFACASYVGPAIAPLVGGYINQSHLGWRWIYWVMFIYSMGIWVVCVLLLRETSHHIILAKRASKKRKETGDPKWHCPTSPQISGRILARAVLMPLMMMVREPIILFCNVYISIAYIIFFGDLESYDTVFSPYGITQGQIGLMFLPIMVGFILAWCTTPFIVSHYARVARVTHAQPPPEVRIIPLLLVSPLLPISLFWSGWTAGFQSISLWCPGVAGLVFGFSFIILFISVYQYLIDVYETNAATALAAITLARYWVSGVWVVFVRQIYKNMGTHWAFSLLGFVSAAMIPVTWVFFRYGKHIRSRSTFVQNFEENEVDIVKTLWM